MFPITLIVLALAAHAQTAPPPTGPASWPRTLQAGNDRLQVYQPQIESWTDDRISGRAAIAIGPVDGAPSYGVLTFEARVEVDKPSGLVRMTDLRIDDVQIPTEQGESADVKSAIEARIAERVPKAGITAALDQLQTAYDVGQDIAKVASVPVHNDPPRIIFTPAPAALVLIDGDPVDAAVGQTGYMRVVNSRALILRDSHGGVSVRADGRWYVAGNLEGPWSVLATPPAALQAAAAAAAQEQKTEPLGAPAPGPAPALFVSTVPAELIVTQGEPQFTPVGELTLLEMRNADHAVFLDPTQNRFYVLVSGRWFAGAGLAGPWTFVPGDQLPPDFAKIPPDDPKANARVSIAGTPEAKEAVIASTIPQTATIERSKATLSVAYGGGKPQFQPIPSTGLAYAVNTSTPVIEVGAHDYYAVSNGVWFVAPTPTGPWHVADAVPPSIYTIPPESPLHYVTYVRVYGATPTTVVVGYKPGYAGVVVTPGGTVVYGTGYVYPPVVVGPVYYPYPPTYGYNAGFALGAATGFAFGFAAGYWARPYWGPYYGPTNWAHLNINQTNFYGAWGSASVTHANGWTGATSWNATHTTAFNPYTGRSYAGSSVSAYNPATGAEAAGHRGGYYNPQTGTTAGARSGAAYNPQTGNYAAGRQAAGYNPTTGRGTAHSTTVTGNTGGGYSVNSKGAAVNTRTDTGVAWKNGDVYAGHDGNVYRRQDGSWEQYNKGSGWSPVQSSSQNLGSLEQQRQGRELGQQRVWNSGRLGNAGAQQIRRGGYRRY
jgi:hypothetical protein